jgi:1-acyl-sn-glycerol-3-phosphate acyltransferase
MMKPGVVLRSALFTAALFVITPLYALLAVGTFPLPALTRYRIIKGWAVMMMWLLDSVCGIRYRVLGAGRIPAGRACIIMSKHQSAWETIAFQLIFPPQVQVIKRELLWIPFFGWGLAMVSPIAIDRGAGRRALRQLADQGADRLARGFWVIVFPEGTRVAPGVRVRYRLGGAILASETGAPVIPVAHNAGRYWRRRAFIKHPGTVTVSIGEPIDPRNFTPESLIRHVETWIEAEMLRIDGAEIHADETATSTSPEKNS